MIERYQSTHMVSIELETETAKLIHALALNKANNINVTIAIEFLSRSILRHLINESQISAQYSNPRTMITIEKCSRNLLHAARWSRTAIENSYETTTSNVISLSKLFQLRKQYLQTGLGVDIAGGKCTTQLEESNCDQMLVFRAVRSKKCASRRIINR